MSVTENHFSISYEIKSLLACISEGSVSGITTPLLRVAQCIYMKKTVINDWIRKHQCYIIVRFKCINTMKKLFLGKEDKKTDLLEFSNAFFTIFVTKLFNSQQLLHIKNLGGSIVTGILIMGLFYNIFVNCLSITSTIILDI